LNGTALVKIPVGVVVERVEAASPWLDFVWRPSSILPGVPSAEPWTPLSPQGTTTAFYAGAATIEFHRTETDNYIGNLASGAPQLWVVLRRTDASPPYQLFAVTADPAEGEAFTEAGNDLVDTVPMPVEIAQRLEAFIAEHHVERPFFKRQRDTAGAAKGGWKRGGGSQ
jgi:hypothetical protein